MRGIRKFFAIILLALTVGLHAPSAFAQGTAESPGVQDASSSSVISVSAEGTAESPGYMGTAESPGYMTTVLIYLDVIV
jgi:hypothetical protein